jgi:hypothetical protein
MRWTTNSGHIYNLQHYVRGYVSYNAVYTQSVVGIRGLAYVVLYWDVCSIIHFGICRHRVPNMASLLTSL